jgi:hypothetical protein
MTIELLESQENSSGIREIHEFSESAVHCGLARGPVALERELAQ